MSHAPSGVKRRTNVTIDSGLLDAARELGLNVSAISETALAQTLKQAQAKGWAEENAEAIARRRDWIDREGTPLARWQMWSPG